MADTKQIRKVAQCVRTLLETDGVEVTLRKVTEVIKDQDLNDPNSLKDLVLKTLDNTNDMRDTTSKDGPSERQQKIETFMSKNWSQIRDDDVVKAVLLDAYCKGRIKKDKRQTMQEELVKRCEATTSDSDTDEDTDNPSFAF